MDLTTPISSKYSQLKLDHSDAIPIEYVFIDKEGNLRSKAETLHKIPTSIKDIPPLILQDKDPDLLEEQYQPIAMYRDPFRPQQGRLVLCEAPTRQRCLEIMDHYAHLEPWFGMEQEYVLFDPKTNKPWGWPQHGEPEKQGTYYCGVGAGRVFGRDIMEAHYRACLFAGITLCGCNAEVTPSQLEYQVGPCLGVTIGDEMYMARYIMERIAEEFGAAVSLHPKPIPGDWNPTGCHINFSTNEMRSSPDGLLAIDQAVENMSSKHFEHIEVYGQDNELRLTGEYETGHISVFSCGVGNRGASIRIPRRVAVEGKGYMEDRRPAGNIDPYAATTIIMTSSFNYKSPYEQEFFLFSEETA
ncbi:Glutamine synthetase [Choanephora cucurbitarum]|uniref:Glutamine synthetase n=1 Tax=Choanephora cucurbitarum TaxID=101091 RepID=A0A1C7NAK4_9FUNG|nr:Glutamine synthetase [Choanephora cucurbitarum]